MLSKKRLERSDGTPILARHDRPSPFPRRATGVLRERIIAADPMEPANIAPALIESIRMTATRKYSNRAQEKPPSRRLLARQLHGQPISLPLSSRTPRSSASRLLR